MKMPRAALLVVDERKITEYLLNPAHPDNSGKAAFFLSLDFNGQDWRLLAASLRKLAETGTVFPSLNSSHGRKYIVDGRIETPSGKTPKVRSVWIVDCGFDMLRLVTAYPQGE